MYVDGCPNLLYPTATSPIAGRARSRRDARVAAVLLLAVVAGCSGEAPKYSVQGTVTYDGKVVPTGWVLVLSEAGQRYSAEIDSNGQYHIELPKGEYQLGVSAPRESSSTSAEPFEEKSLPPYVPFRFGQPENTGLSVAVEANQQNTHDIAIPAGRRGER